MAKKMRPKPKRKPAVPPDKRSTAAFQATLTSAVDSSGLTIRQLQDETGISLAICRRIKQGRFTDLKASTLIRLLPIIGLELVSKSPPKKARKPAKKTSAATAA